MDPSRTACKVAEQLNVAFHKSYAVLCVRCCQHDAGLLEGGRPPTISPVRLTRRYEEPMNFLIANIWATIRAPAVSDSSTSSSRRSVLAAAEPVPLEAASAGQPADEPSSLSQRAADVILPVVDLTLTETRVSRSYIRCVCAFRYYVRCCAGAFRPAFRNHAKQCQHCLSGLGLSGAAGMASRMTNCGGWRRVFAKSEVSEQLAAAMPP